MGVHFNKETVTITGRGDDAKDFIIVKSAITHMEYEKAGEDQWRVRITTTSDCKLNFVLEGEHVIDRLNDWLNH